MAVIHALTALRGALTTMAIAHGYQELLHVEISFLMRLELLVSTLITKLLSVWTAQLGSSNASCLYLFPMSRTLQVMVMAMAMEDFKRSTQLTVQ